MKSHNVPQSNTVGAANVWSSVPICDTDSKQRLLKWWKNTNRGWETLGSMIHSGRCHFWVAKIRLIFARHSIAISCDGFVKSLKGTQPCFPALETYAHYENKLRGIFKALRKRRTGHTQCKQVPKIYDFPHPDLNPKMCSTLFQTLWGPVTSMGRPKQFPFFLLSLMSAATRSPHPLPPGNIERIKGRAGFYIMKMTRGCAFDVFFPRTWFSSKLCDPWQTPSH